MSRQDGSVLIEGAKIVNRNFAGRADMYNRDGVRNFGVLLDEQTAVDMLKDGWNVKTFKVREEGDTPQAFIQVGVSFKVRPPQIWLVTSAGRTLLDEEAVDTLDYADIKKADLIFTPYPWEVGEKKGVKAYLKTMYVEIEEDELDLKYRELDELPARSGRVSE